MASVEAVDPHRWLEDSGADDVRAWQDAQNAATDRHLEAWPHLDALRMAVERNVTPASLPAPSFAGGRWFRLDSAGAAGRSALHTSLSPSGPWELAWAPGPGATVALFSTSPDGRFAACGVAEAGNEMRLRLEVVDVAAGVTRPEPVPGVLDVWCGAPQWLADGRGFFYSAVDEAADVLTHVAFLCRLDAPLPSEPEPLTAEADYDGYLMVQTDARGRWAVGSMGLEAPRPLNVRDLEAGTPWRPFARGLAGASISGVIEGNRYVAVTDHAAPRGRVVEIPLDGTGDTATWRELVAESDAVLRCVHVVGGRLYVAALVDTYSRMFVFEQDGTPVREVALPGRGALSGHSPGLVEQARSVPADQCLFGFATFTSSWGLYREDPDTGELTELAGPAARLEGAVVDDRWATSVDGARVPYHVLRLESTTLDERRPALLHAYGGYNVALEPRFPGAPAAFVEAGGLYVLAHLRGGGELGRQWWEQGRGETKQRSYDDLYAIAEDLIADGLTSPDLLAVQGASNGGLMAGVALTQRPDLWAVGVPLVPSADLLRHGAYFADCSNELELGDPKDPADARRLASLSPYHLVVDGERYPAAFIGAGETDELCPPWHARKLVARLQAATASDKPVLLRVWPGMGHGLVDSREEMVARETEWLAFVFKCLGVVPASPASCNTKEETDE